ncbi:hypothetical protein Tco_0653057 [Tanacetum coccineum]|uniref:Uncharacterized protein n=1 Tax=Tanacetum coccineum TaxID=301880 RepID=A0ABQ4WZB2_9ASTR
MGGSTLLGAISGESHYPTTPAGVNREEFTVGGYLLVTRKDEIIYSKPGMDRPFIRRAMPFDGGDGQIDYLVPLGAQSKWMLAFRIRESRLSETETVSGGTKDSEEPQGLRKWLTEDRSSMVTGKTLPPPVTYSHYRHFGHRAATSGTFDGGCHCYIGRRAPTPEMAYDSQYLGNRCEKGYDALVREMPPIRLHEMYPLFLKGTEGSWSTLTSGLTRKETVLFDK